MAHADKASGPFPRPTRLPSLQFTGAYIFSIFVSQSSSHFILRSSALPGTSSCIVIFCGFMSALFMTKATPALDQRDVGSLDVMMSRFLLKISRTWLVISPSIYVSCSAKIAILFLYSVLLISPHWLRSGVSCDAAPFIFSVAMLMFAFPTYFSIFYCGVLLVPDVGLQWYSHGLTGCGLEFFLPLSGCRVCVCVWA